MKETKVWRYTSFLVLFGVSIVLLLAEAGDEISLTEWLIIMAVTKTLAIIIAYAAYLVIKPIAKDIKE